MKRIWEVADFAKHAGISHIKARRTLLRIDAESGGALFAERGGKLRFYVATLRKLRPELFAEREELEPRLGELAETVSEVRSDLRRVTRATADNTRAIARLAR